MYSTRNYGRKYKCAYKVLCDKRLDYINLNKEA